MKKFIYCLLLVCGVLLLSGCEETKMDKNNAKNPDKFVVEHLKDIYDIDAKVISQETRKFVSGTNEYEYEYFELKYNDVNFSAVTYWHVSDAIPTRHYLAESDYKDVVNEKILKDAFKGLNLVVNKTDINVYSYIPNYVFELNLKDGELDKALNKTIDLFNNNRDLKVYFYVNYNDRSTRISINSNTSVEEIKSDFNKLR